MTPGAGERARELAPAWADEWYKTQPNLYDYLEGKLAEALAAVRLEEREACIQDIQDAVGDWGGPEREHYTQAMQRATEAIRKREQGLDLWGRPLAERAVEGK